MQWSAAHSQRCLSAARDGTVRLHQLNGRAGGAVGMVPAPAVGLAWERFALVASRAAYVMAISEPPDVIERWAPLTCSQEDSQARSPAQESFQPAESFRTAEEAAALTAVEVEVQRRDFAVAFPAALAAAELYASRGQRAAALAVLELCYERHPPPADPLPLPAELSPLAVFAHEVALYAYYIPPNFPEHLSTPADPSTLERIESLKLRLELEQFIEQEAADELVEREQ